MLTLTLPSIPAQVADIPSKNLRKVARAMGVSPTITNALGKRVYKPAATLRIEMEKFLAPPVEVPPMDAEVVLDPPPAVVVEEPKVEALETAQDLGKVMTPPGLSQKPVKAFSKIALVAEAMVPGATMAQLKEIVSMPNVYFAWDLKNKGLGTRKVGDRYFLVLPQGQTELVYK